MRIELKVEQFGLEHQLEWLAGPGAGVMGNIQRLCRLVTMIGLCPVGVDAVTVPVVGIDPGQEINSGDTRATCGSDPDRRILPDRLASVRGKD